MKKLVIRILSAVLTFTLGLCAANLTRFRPAPVAKVKPVSVVANNRAPLPPPLLAEETQQHQDEVEEVMQPHPVSISPYEIKRLIDEDQLPSCERGGYSGFSDFEAIWEKLNIKIKDENDAFPERCGSPAKANIYPIELDGQPGNEVVLKLDFGTPESTLYLIFKHNNQRSMAEWYMLGSIPYRYGAPFFPPSHKVIGDGQHRWLVIDYPTGHGSAFGSGANDWYEVSEDGVRKVLSYQDCLFLGFNNPDIDRDTKVSKIEYRDGISTVVLLTLTTYEGRLKEASEPFPLWTTTRRTVFIRGPGMQGFVLDAQHSEMSANEIDRDYSPDGEISNQDILKYNYREVAKIAARGNAQQKEWLRDYLDACDESLEKQSLQTALGDKQP